MATCPICKKEAKELDRTGDHDGFDCPLHNKFKVSDTAMVTRKDEPESSWEKAFAMAKARTSSEDWPLIRDQDFI